MARNVFVVTVAAVLLIGAFCVFWVKDRPINDVGAVLIYVAVLVTVVRIGFWSSADDGDIEVDSE